MAAQISLSFISQVLEPIGKLIRSSRFVRESHKRVPLFGGEAIWIAAGAGASHTDESAPTPRTGLLARDVGHHKPRHNRLCWLIQECVDKRSSIQGLKAREIKAIPLVNLLPWH